MVMGVSAVVDPGLPRRVVAVALLLSGCALSPIELEGRACTREFECADGYECDKGMNRCVREGTAVGDGDGDLTGAGALLGDGDGDVPGDGDVVQLDAAVESPGFDGELPDMGAVCDPLPDAPAACPQECTGGCDGIVCIIDCLLPYGCSLGRTRCPDGFFCHVNCAAPGACTPPANFECGDVGCHIECAPGTGACSGMRLTCGKGFCDMTCPTGGSGGSVLAPTVTCGDSCACAPECVPR